MKQLKITALLMSLLLAACGGGGGYTEGDDDGGGDGGGGSTTVSRVILLSSAPQLPSASTSSVVLSAQALDNRGNLISASSITFSIPPSSGALNVAADDSSGTYTATLTTAGDPTPRTIDVTATASGVSTTLGIPVTGTTLTLAGPDTVGFGQTGEYVATLVDSAGVGIGGKSVNFTTTAGSLSVSSANTAATTGIASTVLTGSTSGAVTAQVLGLSATHAVEISADQFSILAPAASANIPLNSTRAITVQWLRDGSAAETAGTTVNLSSSRGTITPNSVTLDSTGQASASISSANAGGAVIVASSPDLTQPSATVAIEFIATTASAINVQAEPATLAVGESSLIRAIVRDARGNLVKGKTVNFTLTDVSGGTLSAPSALTNSQGIASVTYKASSVTSSSGGVRVDATVRDTPSVTAAATLTVGGRALRITLGTGNLITEANTTTYNMPYSVIVTDASGNPVSDATFRLSVLPVAYGKGVYERVYDDDTFKRWSIVTAVGCENEDVDYDGVLSSGEDFNGNGALDPGNVVSAPTTVTLDSSGAGEFNLRYPQDRAGWVAVQLRGVATVAGTETTANVSFTLPGLASKYTDEEVAPPGQLSPYGVVQNCASPN